MNDGKKAVWYFEISEYEDGSIRQTNGNRFQEWLAQHDREVRAQAIRDAAEDIWIGDAADIDRHGNDDPIRDAEAAASAWLLAEADRIESGPAPDLHSGTDTASENGETND